MMTEENITETRTLYDSIGLGYSNSRREDPVIFKKILAALGTSQTIVNVGAGSGSYEPRDRQVIAVEPSEVMSRQRRMNGPPVIRATADDLPFHDKSFDACMTILSLHHWKPNQKIGVQEMRRIARERVVIVTIDPKISGRMWLMADYLQETAILDNEIFPSPEAICNWLDCDVNVEVVPISRNTPDWMLLSFWAHPERVLDPEARSATSGFARQPEGVVSRVVSDVARDLENGIWEKRYGYLRDLNEFDAGLRLITGTLR